MLEVGGCLGKTVGISLEGTGAFSREVSEYVHVFGQVICCHVNTRSYSARFRACPHQWNKPRTPRTTVPFTRGYRMLHSHPLADSK
jgi:hypothetical protein